jgi:hypothetical protein
MSELTATLDAVEVEDQTLVKEIIAVIKTLKLCTTWTVNVVPKGYEIQAWISTKDDIIVSLEDLDLIQQVNRLRIQMSGIKIFGNISKACVRVLVFSHKEPVMLQEQTVLRINKRKTWL